jgi:calcineurin-like phosphoesterase family protein
MIDALTKADWDIDNPDHIFVSCGDLLDRGWHPEECLDFVNNLPKDRKILIRGNHEDLLDEAIKRGFLEYYDYSNGTATTVQLLNHNPSMENPMLKFEHNIKYKTYKESLYDYYQVQNYIFVHGWVPNSYNKVDPTWESGDWESARWDNGMKKWHFGAKIEGKTIVCGHWHTSWGHHYIRESSPEWDEQDGIKANFDPFIDNGIIALDACTAYSGKCNCYRIDIEDNIN